MVYIFSALGLEFGPGLGLGFGPGLGLQFGPVSVTVTQSRVDQM